jgi:peptide deformylase
MSVLDLVQIDRAAYSKKDISLRRPASEVVDFGEAFQSQVDDLIDTFWNHKIAVGLAAPQVGISLRVAVINATRDSSRPMLVLVNPRILSLSGKKDKKKESCMSVPGVAGEVERRKKVTVSFTDRYGSEEQLEVEGFLARVIQHEVDHLDGILYLDRMENLSRIEKTDLFDHD